MEKKLSGARTLAGILGILLVIAIIVIFTQHKTIVDLKSPAKQSITAQADLIRQHCSAADAVSKEECANDLQNLSDLLSTFSKQKTASTTVNANLGNIEIKPTN